MLSEKEIEVIRDGWSGEASLSREGEDINDLLDTIKARDERIGELEKENSIQAVRMGHLQIRFDAAIKTGTDYFEKLTAAEDEVKRLREGIAKVIANEDSMTSVASNLLGLLPDDFWDNRSKALASSSGEGE